ncbi:glycine-N-acyltransferase-like protein 3 isoform X2 [Babylonia areolata]
MAVKLSETQLPQLLPWLEKHLPYTFKVHGDLQNYLREQYPDLEFFVDRWPHPRALVARVNPASEQTGVKRLEVDGVFGTNDEALLSLLKDPDIVQWDSSLVLCSLTINLDAVLRAVEQMGKSTKLTVATLLTATPADLKRIPVPEGTKLRAATTADVSRIFSTWKFAGDRTDYLIQERVERYPSVYLETDTGHHVGHMLSTNYGTMGMLYVNPDFRRKGYAKVLISHMAQKFFDMGKDAHVFIEEDNSPSRKLHEGLGFWVVSGMKFVWVKCV